jgi:hypothetical protein
VVDRPRGEAVARGESSVSRADDDCGDAVDDSMISCKGDDALGPPQANQARGTTPLDPRKIIKQGGRPPWTPAS